MKNYGSKLLVSLALLYFAGLAVVRYNQTQGVAGYHIVLYITRHRSYTHEVPVDPLLNFNVEQYDDTIADVYTSQSDTGDVIITGETLLASEPLRLDFLPKSEQSTRAPAGQNITGYVERDGSFFMIIGDHRMVTGNIDFRVLPERLADMNRAHIALDSLYTESHHSYIESFWVTPKYK